MFQSEGTLRKLDEKIQRVQQEGRGVDQVVRSISSVFVLRGSTHEHRSYPQVGFVWSDTLSSARQMQ